MIKKIPVYKDLPFEIDKIYKTKLQTGESFLVKDYQEKIVKDRTLIIIKGIYQSHPHLGIVPLDADRLIPDRVFDKEIEVCDHCNTPIN